MIKRALIAGTFDPITVGHLDLVKRAAEIFDTVELAIFENPDKVKRFSLKTRLAANMRAIEDIPNASATVGEGFTGEFAKARGAVIVKGVRNARDFEYERLQADYHREHFGTETLLLICDEKYADVSSTRVREAFSHGEDVSALLPDGVIEILEKEI